MLIFCCFSSWCAPYQYSKYTHKPYHAKLSRTQSKDATGGLWVAGKSKIIKLLIGHVLEIHYLLKKPCEKWPLADLLICKENLPCLGQCEKQNYNFLQ